MPLDGFTLHFLTEELRRDIGLFGNVGYSLQRYRPDFQELNRYHDIEYLDNSSLLMAGPMAGLM